MEKFNEMINDEQLTLVDFFATWCGPCKMMHPILEQLKEKMGDDIRILKVDVDKEVKWKNCEYPTNGNQSEK